MASLKPAKLVTFEARDRKSTRLNSSHGYISYAVFCLKKKQEFRLHLAPLLLSVSALWTTACGAWHASRASGVTLLPPIDMHPAETHIGCRSLRLPDRL